MTGTDLHDREAYALLRPLCSEPPTPARIDARRAMADGTRRRRRNRWAGAAAAGALVAVVAVVGPAVLNSAHRDRHQVAPAVQLSPAPVPPVRQPTRVPDVLGLHQADAEAMLRSLKFRPRAILRIDATREPGTVIAQSPEQNGLVSRGSVVTIEVSK
jgi:hypothetical protein